MNTIWKYTLKPECSIEMPEVCTILHVGEQYGEVCMWAMVDTEAEKETRNFIIVGTGHEIKHRYIVNLGTVILHNGSLVLHVFEDKKVEC